MVQAEGPRGGTGRARPFAPFLLSLLFLPINVVNHRDKRIDFHGLAI